ncbi:LPXTG cell wall anchor domain-containing protein [Streptococcus gallolyticus]|nr:LPXTG cell wall anchor domain-containing protein [Streptococcus gallolyticus]MBY5041777.1 LPXTG cell wall anchor domain-containing protein [Streptococcus gallolyticus]
MYKNNKQTFGLRKAKNVTTLVGCEVGLTASAKKVITGVALAGALAVPAFGGNVASADEVGTGNPATNLVEVQPSATEANVEAGSNANKTETITSEVTSTELNKAVDGAKEAGVNVSTGEAVTYDSHSDATNDLGKQAEEVKEVTETHTEAVKTVDKANAEVAKLETEAKAAGITVNKTTKTVDKATEVNTTTKAASETVATYKDAKAAADNANQASATVADKAKAVGVNVSTSASTTVKTADQVNADLSKQEGIINTYTDTKASAEKANKAVEDLVAKAKEAGLTITLTDTSASTPSEVNSDLSGALKAVEDYKTSTVSVEAANKDAEAIKALAEKAGVKVVEKTATVTAGTNPNTAGNAEAKSTIAAFEALKEEAEVANQKADEKYKAEYAAYEKKLAEAQATTNKVGYLSEVVIQGLVMKSESNAKLAVEFQGEAEKRKTTVFDGRVNHDYDYHIQGDGKLVATYTNLENSYYNGKKIAKAVYTYSDPQRLGVWLNVHNDPTVTVTYEMDSKSSGYVTGTSKLAMDVEYFYEDGSKVTYNAEAPAVFALNSMNLSKNYAGTGTGEGVTVLSGNAKFVSINGSTVAQEGKLIHATKYNDYKSNGSDYESSEWDTSSSATRYYGAGALVVSSGDKLTLELSMDQVNAPLLSSGRYWFALNTNVSSPVIEKPVKPTPKEINPPATGVEVTTYNVAKPELSATTYKVTAPSIEVPTYNVDKPQLTAVVYKVAEATVPVHEVLVKQTPQITKAVKNADDVDIDTMLVPKGEVVSYELNAPTLKAGRPVYASGKGQDALPSGYVTLVEETIKANEANYVLTYNEASNTYDIAFTNDLVAKLNSDNASDFKLPNLVVVGFPSNDGATYENTWKLKLTEVPDSETPDKPGKTTTIYSNTVIIHTPGKDKPQEPDPENPKHGGSVIKPVKKVLDKDGKDIDGKTVTQGDVITYVGKWDLDQYKDIVASAVAISRGFGYLDNYDESKVKFLTDTAKFNTKEDGTGQNVDGLKAYVIKDVSEAPKEIQDMLKKAGIEIAKGDEFVFWVAENPQEFYDKYVKTGTNVYMIANAETKAEGKADNVIYQVDFGNGYVSNVVTINIVKPKEPAKPTPPVPQKETPVAPASVLPHTGEASSIISYLGAALLAAVNFLFLGKKKEEAE